MATKASSYLPKLLRRRLAEDSPTLYRKFKHWIIHRFLPFWVSVAIALWGVFFTLQHPEILISIVGPSLAVLVAPVVILVVCFYANWWLYSISVPKTFSHWNGLIKNIREEGWNRLSVLRVVALILTGSFVLLMAPTFFASLTTMLPIYVKLIGIGLTINPIGLYITAGIIVAIVSLTTLCLLFDHFDDLVRLLFDPKQKIKRAKAWHSFIQNFQPSKTSWPYVILTCILLALSVFISVGAAAAVVAAAAPHMVALLKLIGMNPHAATITVSIMAYGMALASRLPFALKGLAQIALSVRDTLINIKPATIHFVKELNRRRLIVLRAKGMRLAAIQRYWLVPVWQFVIVAPINGFTSFCTGLSGSKALHVWPIGLATVSGSQTSAITISGVIRSNDEIEKSSNAAILQQLKTVNVTSSDELFRQTTPEHIALQETVLRYGPTLDGIIANPSSGAAAKWLSFTESSRCIVQSSLQHKLHVFTAQSESTRWQSLDNHEFSSKLGALSQASGDDLLLALLSIRLNCEGMPAEQLVTCFDTVIAILAQQELNSEACISSRATALIIAEKMGAQRAILFNQCKENNPQPLALNILADDQDKLADALKSATDTLTRANDPAEIDAALKALYLLIVDINNVPESLLETLAAKLNELNDDVVITFLKHFVPHIEEITPELFMLAINRLSRNTAAYQEIFLLMAPKLDGLVYMDESTQCLSENLFNDLYTKAEAMTESDVFLTALSILPRDVLSDEQQERTASLIQERITQLSSKEQLTLSDLALLTTLTTQLTSLDNDMLNNILALLKKSSHRAHTLKTLAALIDQQDEYDFTPLLTAEQVMTIKQTLLDCIGNWDHSYSTDDIWQLRTLANKLQLNGVDYQQWCENIEITRRLFQNVAARVIQNRGRKLFEVDDLLIEKCKYTLANDDSLTMRFTALSSMQQLCQEHPLEEFALEENTTELALAAITRFVQQPNMHSEETASLLTILANTIHSVKPEQLIAYAKLDTLRELLQPIVANDSNAMAEDAANVLIVLQAKTQDNYYETVLAGEEIQSANPDNQTAYRLKLVMEKMQSAKVVRKELYRTLVEQFNTLVSAINERPFIVNNTAGLFTSSSPAVNLLQHTRRPQTMAAIEKLLLGFLKKEKIEALAPYKEDVSDKDIQALYQVLEDCNQLRKNALSKLFSFINRHKTTHDYYRDSTTTYEAAVRHLSIATAPTGY